MPGEPLTDIARGRSQHPGARPCFRGIEQLRCRTGAQWGETSGTGGTLARPYQSLALAEAHSGGSAAGASARGRHLPERAAGVQQNDSMASPSRTRTGADGDPVRIRLAAAAAALVIVGMGLGLRATTGGGVAKYGGDALYTLLLFALVILVAPRSTPLKAGGVALAVSWGVEFLQLSDLPAELSRHSTAARLVLGSTFDAPDLFWYAVGAVAGWLAVRLAHGAKTRCAAARGGSASSLPGGSGQDRLPRPCGARDGAATADQRRQGQ